MKGKSGKKNANRMKEKKNMKENNEKEAIE